MLDGNALSKEKERLKEKIKKLESDVEELEVELAGLNARQEGYKLELRSPLSAGLAGHEEVELENLGKEVEGRRKQVIELGSAKNKVRLFQK